MNIFIQAVAGALIAVIFCALLSGQRKDITLLLSLAVCSMILLAAVNFLEPVVELMDTLREAGQLDPQLLQTILKAVAIGLIAELAALICSDGGNAALGRAVEILAGAVVLWLSIPLMKELLELVQKMAGAV